MKPTIPLYKTWSLEKLQNEYFTLRLTSTAQELQFMEMKERLETIQEFLNAFNKLIELTRDDNA